MFSKEPVVLGARDFLALYLEFRSLTPNRRHWNPKRLAGNPPRLIRLQRLLALLRAFGIPTKLADFHKGEFIDASNPEYAPLLARIAIDLHEVVAERWKAARWEPPDELQFLFSRLLEYRIELDAALVFNRGLLCASGLFYYAYQKTGELNGLIRPHLGVVEDLLAQLISPAEATFTTEALARDHGYPLVNLFEIDVRWV